MQFLLPKTQNIKDYFLSLTSAKKFIFVLTVLSFIAAGSFFALGASSAFIPGVSSGKKEITSPTDFFGRAAKSTVNKSGGKAESTEAKTVASPLNGVLYTPAEAAEWQARRPLALTVNNHVLVRPQSGVSSADIVYEAVAEGGITRLLAIFHSNIPEVVGAVRSARVHFVDFAKENDAWLGHWGGWKNGGPADAYDHMRQIYVNSVDAMDSIHDISSAFYRDNSNPSLPLEHTGFAKPQEIYNLAYKFYPDQPREYRQVNKSWIFKDDAAESQRADAQTASFNFWDLPDFKVIWTYDKASNTYKRSQGGKPHMDKLVDVQLAAKNVLVLFMDETSLNDGHGHLLYKATGQGIGKAFIDGKETNIKWSRPTLADRTRFLVSTGTTATSASTDLELNRGQIWIEVLPTGTAVSIQ